MLKPSVYVETTIVSYLVARPIGDVVRRGQQEITRQWWQDRRKDFSLFTSQFVIDESLVGDPKAVKNWLAVIDQIDLLGISAEVAPLAESLITGGALPPKAQVDALHLAVATINGLRYLLTWNCKHLANVFLWDKIERVCQTAGYVPPVILTPYELLGK
jgi:hypothetical protein